MMINMIRVEKSHFPVAARTHAGMSGKNNEDRFAVTAFSTGKDKSAPVLLAVLADGIGGHRAGEVAAEIAVNRITQTVADSNGQNPISLIEGAIQLASQEIFQAAEEDVERKGMGATCAVALLTGNQLYMASVGDSRVYLLREGKIYQLSNDHTWIQEALDLGLLEPEQVVGHPNAHVIRRFLGSARPPEVDFRLRFNEQENDRQSLANQGMRLQRGDLLLLCSDGLTDLVKDAEILEICSQQAIEPAADALVDLANTRGGHDNITVILVQVSGPAADSKPPAKIKTWVGITCLSLVILAALVAGIWLGWNWLRQGIQPTQTPSPQVPLDASAQPDVFETVVTPQPIPTNPSPLLETPVQSTLESSIATIEALSTDVLDGATLTPWPTNTLPPVTQ